MPLVSTGLTEPGLKAEFQERFDAANSHWGDLSTRIASTTGKESYGFLGTVPPMRELGTGRLARGMFAEKYDVENLTYEITLEVARNEIADDQVGGIRLRVGELAERAALHKDSEIGRLLINGASAGFLSYDGVPFFGATHESGKSGTQDNTIAPAASDPADPTVAEFKTAIKLGIARLLSLNDDQGEPMNQSASGLVLITPPATYLTALEVVNATLVDSTTNVLTGAARVIAFPYLTAAQTFYLLKTDVSVRPFIFQDREAIEFTALENQSETGFMREKFLYGVRARYRMSFGYWQRAIQATFA